VKVGGNISNIISCETNVCWKNLTKKKHGRKLEPKCATGPGLLCQGKEKYLGGAT